MAGVMAAGVLANQRPHAATISNPALATAGDDILTAWLVSTGCSRAIGLPVERKYTFQIAKSYENNLPTCMCSCICLGMDIY
jgi:hypothetical protein